MNNVNGDDITPGWKHLIVGLVSFRAVHPLNNMIRIYCSASELWHVLIFFPPVEIFLCMQTTLLKFGILNMICVYENFLAAVTFSHIEALYY